jgi:hypothetical protein
LRGLRPVLFGFLLLFYMPARRYCKLAVRGHSMLRPMRVRWCALKRFSLIENLLPK